MDDFWIDHGSDLSEYFTIFLVLGEGSRVAVWHGPGCDVEDSPVVLMGSEGELEFLGASALHFLARVAVDDALDVTDLPEPGRFEPFRSQLAAWLGNVRLPVGLTLAELAAGDPRGAHPDLGAWFDEMGAAARTAAASDATIGALHERLEAVVDADELGRLSAWDSIWFEVSCLGPHFECWHRKFGRQPVPQEVADQIEPLAHMYRRQRASTIEGRGGWFEAVFRRYPHGWATPACFFEFPGTSEMSGV